MITGNFLMYILVLRDCFHGGLHETYIMFGLEMHPRDARVGKSQNISNF